MERRPRNWERRLRHVGSALRVDDVRLPLEQCAESIHGIDRMRRHAVVVALQRRQGLRIGADHGYGFIARFQRQDVVLILQQHHRLARRLQGQFPVLERIVLGKGNAVEGHRLERVEHPHANARREQAFQGSIDFAFLNQAIVDGFYQRDVFVPASGVPAWTATAEPCSLSGVNLCPVLMSSTAPQSEVT